MCVYFLLNGLKILKDEFIEGGGKVFQKVKRIAKDF